MPIRSILGLLSIAWMIAPFEAGAWLPRTVGECSYGTSEQEIVDCNKRAQERFLAQNPCFEIQSVQVTLGAVKGGIGYSEAADLNHDGIIDQKDIEIARQHIPKGVTCE